MNIEASVRPRNLKRGTSDKKLAAALGFKEPIGLSDAVGRLEFSAESRGEFMFLKGLYKAFHPLSDKPTRIIVEIGGKTICCYTQPGASAPKGK